MKQDPNILILVQDHPPAVARLRERYPRGKIVVGPWLGEGAKPLPVEMLRDVELLFCELLPDNFDDLKSLRWLQLTSAGYSQILDLPLLKRGIRVSNGVGNYDVPIAEWNLMMMLWWQRRMLDAQEAQRAHRWDTDAKYQQELRGATVGLYAYGGIARETARLAKTMGLKVWAMARGTVGPRPNNFILPGTGDPQGVLPDRVFTPDQTAEFLGGLDYLVLSLPLTRVTRGLIGEKELRQLPPDAVLINCGRGPVVEEKALLRGLAENWIRGASLDVHFAYPLPPEHPLWSMPNVIMTAHTSGASLGPHFLPRTYEIFVQNVDRFCTDRPLLNELTRDQLEGK